MYSRFYLSLLFISGSILFVFTIFAGYKEISPEWKRYQSEYKEMLIKNAKDKATREKAREFDIEHQQIYLDTLKRVDRCMNCHIGVENPLMADARIPFRQHSGNYLKNHPTAKFGCTVCHNGQGRAPNKEDAHGKAHEAHWDYPIIPVKYIQSSCAQCHDYEMLEQNGVDMVVRGERLFRERGCMGCHKLNGVGGDLGKALDGIGSQPFAYFSMRYVVGDHTAYRWIKQHFDDPREIVPESEMRAFLADEESDLLTTYVLTLKADEVPKEYRRISQEQKIRADGELLYKMYCIACHAAGRYSIYDEIFKRTIPAIMNPAFLKTTDDKYLRKFIEEGRAGTQMTAWKPSAAGLTDKEIKNIIKFITRKRPEGKPAPFRFSGFKEDIKHGEEVYKLRCAICHGANGDGGEGLLGINLRNPVVQKLDPEFLAITVRDGRSETPMPPFGKKGVGLRDQEIVDVVAYVRTLTSKK